MQRNKIFTQYAQMFQRKMLNLQPIIKGEEDLVKILIF